SRRPSADRFCRTPYLPAALPQASTGQRSDTPLRSVCPACCSSVCGQGHVNSIGADVCLLEDASPAVAHARESRSESDVGGRSPAIRGVAAGAGCADSTPWARRPILPDYESAHRKTTDLRRVG